jgi:hypothetical protein
MTSPNSIDISFPYYFTPICIIILNLARKKPLSKGVLKRGKRPQASARQSPLETFAPVRAGAMQADAPHTRPGLETGVTTFLEPLWAGFEMGRGVMKL